MSEEQVFVQVIDASREAIWKALTSPEFTRQYWHCTQVRSSFEPGSPIDFLTESGETGCQGEILTASKPGELSYTWQFPRNPLVKDEVPSRVTFRLETLGDDETGRATRLTVVHDRFPDGSRMPEMVGPGWPTVLAGLKTLLETGRAVDFSAMA